MGAQLSTVAPTATVPIDAYVAELGDLTYSSDLGRSRFLKTVRATHREGLAVVKVFIKPTNDQINLKPFKQHIKEISDQLRQELGPLNEFPNAIGYSRVLETDRAGYLVRQYIKHNLYDRISTRPFLEPVEKLWIAYQLLRALQSCHEHGIMHGDIKSENVLVGSWKWIYLVDFAPYKPVRLPETDTAQFLFYFDVSQRRVCYVAPERFSDGLPNKLTPEMDVYSAGCVIAELFMDGQPLFTLADLFKYKSGELEPDMSQISEDLEVQSLVKSMISVDMKERKSAKEYLDTYRGRLFPKYFDTFWDLLAPKSSSVGATSSNEMVSHIYSHFETAVEALGGKLTDAEVLGAPLPVVVKLPQRLVSLETSEPASGALILLSYVCSALTATSSVQWRVRAASIILALATLVPDDAKLDRCLPYLVLLLRDSQHVVRATSLVLITHLLSLVSEYSLLNQQVYTAYVFPRVIQAVSDPADLESRAMLANCLPTLANSAVECEGWEAVVSFVDEMAKMLLVDKAGVVRRALLNSADELCAVLRKQGTHDVILLHAITYLNDKDPFVRMDLFRFISKVAPLVGAATTEQYVAPLLVQSLCDPREDIVTLVIKCLGAMAEVGLLRLKVLLRQVLQPCAKFLIHPNVYIRTQTLILVANTAKHLSQAQIHCLLRPLLQPYLAGEVSDYTNHGSVLEALKPPLAQPVYSLALRWATSASKPGAPKSLFWPVQSPDAPIDAALSATFSTDDRRWLASLREIGFHAEDLWQLFAFKEYFWQLSRMSVHPLVLESKLPTVTLPNGATRLSAKRALSSWTEGTTIPIGLKAYVQAYNAATSTHISETSTQVVIGGTKVSNASLVGHSNLAGVNTKPVPEDSDPLPVSATPQSSVPNTLVSSMKAHRGAINVLATHSNMRHFVTAADDRLIKLWDVRQLLKGSSKPVSIFETEHPVTSCLFLGDTSVLAYSAGDKVTFLQYVFHTNENGNLVYDTTCELGSLDLEPHVVQMHCTDASNVQQYADSFGGIVAVLWVLTSTGRIHKVDLTSLAVVQTVSWPASHGAPTCWVWDPLGDFVVVGTLHGMLELVDVRFMLHVNSWGVGDMNPITAMCAHPFKERHICVAGGYRRNLITTWDVEKVECREVLVPVPDLEEVGVDTELPSLEPITPPPKQLTEMFAEWDLSERYTRPKPPVTALCASKRQGSCSLLTGGGDRILRLWNLRTPYLSAAISGLSYTRGRLAYMGKIGSSVRYTHESWVPPKGAERLPRTTVIANEEQDIGRNHRGSITRVGLLEQASGRDISVSVDEIGMIKVFA